MKTTCSILLIYFLLITSTGYSQTAKEYSDRAMVRYLNNDYNGAISDYTEAIKLAPLNAETYCCRGGAKNSLKDYEGAISDYTKAIFYDPRDATAYYLRGNAKNKINDYDGAISDFTTAIVYDPKDAIAYYKRGLAKHKLGMKEGGCFDLSKAGELGYAKANEAIKQYCQILPKALPSQNDNFIAKSDTVPTWENTVAEKVDKSKLREVTDFVPPKVLADNMSKTETDQTGNSNSHFQIDKIKVGDDFIELPIPNGFVKVDETMGVLLESAKKLCPNTNTLLAYYISEEDYANFLVNQNQFVDKYILIEVFKEIKYKQIGSKDYRQFIKGFKDQYVEEFKQLFDEAGIKASENLSNLDAKLKVSNIKMQPIGICYESKNSISYGALSKYSYSIENERSEDFIVVAISTITKIENKPIFLLLNKTYKRKEDISSLKTINLAWGKAIEKKQRPVSFLADIDFEDYKETILAILTLSFIWAIYFATKKIRRKMKNKSVSANPDKEENNDFVDFDELLVEENITIEPICIEPEKIQQHSPIINPDLLKVSSKLRLINFLIDMPFIYFIIYGTGLYGHAG